MGKVKNEGRQFYKKTIVTNAPPKPLVSSPTTSSFKFKRVENVISKSITQAPTIKPSATKKSKLQQRKRNLIKKISVAQPTSKKRKQQKKKIKIQKQGVARVATLSDLTSLKNALPSLNDNLPSLHSLFMLKTNAELKTGVPQFDKKLKADDGTKPKKLTKAMRTKLKKNVFMKRYDYLQKLLSDKAFKRNPREVIAAHVRNKRLVEQKFENKNQHK